MRIVMTNGFFILAATILFAFLVSPWWQGALYGAVLATVSCLFTDLVFACIRAVVRGRQP